MKVVAIVQARMGSSRLPGKVLMDLCGRPMLAQQLKRLRMCKTIDEIVVATTHEERDNTIADVCKLLDVRCVRGCERDVLARYWQATKESSADVVVRITADCPLIAPEVTDKVVTALLDQPSSYDYASNVIERTYPRGLDTEVLWRDTLERLYRVATSRAAREHVTYHLVQEEPTHFSRLSVVDSSDNSQLRWTVDTTEDLVVVKAIYRELELHKRYVPYEDTLRFVMARPWLSAINYHIRQSA